MPRGRGVVWLRAEPIEPPAKKTKGEADEEEEEEDEATDMFGVIVVKDEARQWNSRLKKIGITDEESAIAAIEPPQPFEPLRAQPSTTSRTKEAASKPRGRGRPPGSKNKKLASKILTSTASRASTVSAFKQRPATKVHTTAAPASKGHVRQISFEIPIIVRRHENKEDGRGGSDMMVDWNSDSEEHAKHTAARRKGVATYGGMKGKKTVVRGKDNDRALQTVRDWRSTQVTGAFAQVEHEDVEMDEDEDDECDDANVDLEHFLAPRVAQRKGPTPRSKLAGKSTIGSTTMGSKVQKQPPRKAMAKHDEVSSDLRSSISDASSRNRDQQDNIKRAAEKLFGTAKSHGKSQRLGTGSSVINDSEPDERAPRPKSSNKNAPSVATSGTGMQTTPRPSFGAVGTSSQRLHAAFSSKQAQQTRKRQPTTSIPSRPLPRKSRRVTEYHTSVHTTSARSRSAISDSDHKEPSGPESRKPKASKEDKGRKSSPILGEPIAFDTTSEHDDDQHDESPSEREANKRTKQYVGRKTMHGGRPSGTAPAASLRVVTSSQRVRLREHEQQPATPRGRRSAKKGITATSSEISPSKLTPQDKMLRQKLLDSGERGTSEMGDEEWLRPLSEDETFEREAEAFDKMLRPSQGRNKSTPPKKSSKEESPASEAQQDDEESYEEKEEEVLSQPASQLEDDSTLSAPGPQTPQVPNGSFMSNIASSAKCLIPFWR